MNRVVLATLPTPLENGGKLPGGSNLWVKRDDLTGLGVGGNKARKLEFLCADALGAGAKSLVTVGAAQSNHCRMTAAAGARLGLPTHLVLSGDEPRQLTGNQLLSAMFGATLHHTGLKDTDWSGLEEFRQQLTDQLSRGGSEPYSIPIGGSTAIGAVGYALAFDEINEQCATKGFSPESIVFTTSSGGTHAGLIAGLVRARAENPNKDWPRIIGIAVAKGAAMSVERISELTSQTLRLLDCTATVETTDVIIETEYMGAQYAVPTKEASEAATWAARRGAWALDPVYSAKGFSGLLGLDAKSCFSADSNTVFIHTGGLPSLFVAH